MPLSQSRTAAVSRAFHPCKKGREENTLCEYATYISYALCASVCMCIPLSHPIIISMAVINLLLSCRLTAQWCSSVRSVCMQQFSSRSWAFSNWEFAGWRFPPDHRKRSPFFSSKFQFDFILKWDYLVANEYAHGRGTAKRANTSRFNVHDLSVPPKTCIRISYSVFFSFLRLAAFSHRMNRFAVDKDVPREIIA